MWIYYLLDEIGVLWIVFNLPTGEEVRIKADVFEKEISPALKQHPKPHESGRFLIFHTAKYEWRLKKRATEPAGPLLKGYREKLDDLWIFSHNERMKLTPEGLNRELLRRG